jgi:peptide/nickel transport system permease protein
MTTYLLRRLLQSIVVIIGVVLITFILVHMLPGGPARAALGPKATPQGVAQFNHENGLDEPLWRQFLIYVGHLLHGDLGFSYVQNQSVASLIGENLPRDILLVGTAYALALAIAIPLGLFQALRRNHFSDYAFTGLSFVLYSMPSFLVGFLLIAAFSVQLQVFPSAAPSGSSIGSILGDPRALVLPVVTLALISIAAFSRYMRSSALENLALDYVRTARAKGASMSRVVRRHLLRNSMLPIVTLVGLSLPTVVAGALVTEEVFNFPGMGLVFFKAAQVQDYPVLIGFSLFVGIATVVGNLLADIAYGVLDPRVRLAAQRS